MRPVLIIASLWFAAIHSADVSARLWTDSSGRYTLDADLVDFNDQTVVLQRADHELVAVAIENLSNQDRDYLKSTEASDLARKSSEEMQTWTLEDGKTLVGRVVDYATVDVTLQRRRGRIYINDRVLDNLPEFYQQLIPSIVAHFESLQRADRRALEAWLVRQRGQPRSFRVEGIILEAENGDEYAVPFFLISEDDQKLLKAGWNAWLAVHGRNDHDAQQEHSFLLQSLAAARHRDKLVQREIAMMQFKLQAVQAGVTSLWEVTLYPAAGQGGPPQWVVVPGRDSRQATNAALQQNPGYVAGPVRRVARG
jgi:hypothetical protein